MKTLPKYKSIWTAGEYVTYVPARRGKWIVDRYCSECEWDKKEAVLVVGIPTNFCPNCGARMEVEE